MPVVSEVELLIAAQLRQWPLAQANYAALDAARLRTLEIGRTLVVLQCNPERRRSSGAKIDAASLAARPCFLCPQGQPPEQASLLWGGGRYKIQLNPYPIFERHLTISATEHVPQSLADPHRLADMLALSGDLPGYVVFYNGPRCGASAPHHHHFQAGNVGMLPLCAEVADPVLWPDEARLEGCREGFIGYTGQLGRMVFFIRTSSEALAALYWGKLELAMMRAAGMSEEPMQNVLCWREPSSGDCCVAVFPRVKHRPDCYGDGPQQYLLSPASVDMGGLWAVPRPEDFERLTVDDVRQFYDELCADAPTTVRIIDNYLDQASVDIPE